MSAWPLILIFIGDAIGGAFAGFAYAANIKYIALIYLKPRKSWQI